MRAGINLGRWYTLHSPLGLQPVAAHMQPPAAVPAGMDWSLHGACAVLPCWPTQLLGQCFVCEQSVRGKGRE